MTKVTTITNVQTESVDFTETMIIPRMSDDLAKAAIEAYHSAMPIPADGDTNENIVRDLNAKLVAVELSQDLKAAQSAVTAAVARSIQATGLAFLLSEKKAKKANRQSYLDLALQMMAEQYGLSASGGNYKRKIAIVKKIVAGSVSGALPALPVTADERTLEQYVSAAAKDSGSADTVAGLLGLAGYDAPKKAPKKVEATSEDVKGLKQTVNKQASELEGAKQTIEQQGDQLAVAADTIEEQGQEIDVLTVARQRLTAQVKDQRKAMADLKTQQATDRGELAKKDKELNDQREALEKEKAEKEKAQREALVNAILPQLQTLQAEKMGMEVMLETLLTSFPTNKEGKTVLPKSLEKPVEKMKSQIKSIDAKIEGLTKIEIEVEA